MDFIRQLGELAIGSRMRRLTDRLVQEVSVIYAEAGIDFEARWFPVFSLLAEKSPMSILDVAKNLGITHPAVNQIAGELIKKGLVDQAKCTDDKRKRLLSLTPQGEALLTELRPLWAAVEAAIHETLTDSGVDLLGALEAVEIQMDNKPYASRIRHFMQSQPTPAPSEEVTIQPFQPGDEADFRRLNTAWIEKYFHIETADERIFANPQECILDKGGHILLARYQGKNVGTCALVKLDESTFELAKMAVDESVQGKQIGSKLLAAAIETARLNGARQVVLESNSNLKAALHLYRKFGFEDIPATALHPSEFARVDIRMKLDLCHEAVTA